MDIIYSVYPHQRPELLNHLALCTTLTIHMAALPSTPNTWLSLLNLQFQSPTSMNSPPGVPWTLISSLRYSLPFTPIFSSLHSTLLFTGPFPVRLPPATFHLSPSTATKALTLSLLMSATSVPIFLAGQPPAAPMDACGFHSTEKYATVSMGMSSCHNLHLSTYFITLPDLSIICKNFLSATEVPDVADVGRAWLHDQVLQYLSITSCITNFLYKKCSNYYISKS